VAEVSLKIVREFLTTSGTDLFDDVGTRISTLGYEDNDSAFITMKRQGGVNTDRLQVARPTVEFRIYSGTGRQEDDPSGPFVAMGIYENFKARLHNVNNQTTTSGFIVSAFEQQQPQDVVNPEDGWPFVLVFYDIMTRDKT
jgi:hypothetical protein